MTNPPPLPALSSQQNIGAYLLISIPLFLLTAAVFTLAILVYYSAPVESEINYQLANDLMADSGNFKQDTFLDEALLQERKIVITTDVNPHLSKQIIASLILLNSRDNQTPIDLYLRTEGGWVSDAFSVVDTMQSISAPVNVYALGGTHSAGAIILTGGTGRRVAMKHSIIMVHDNLTKPMPGAYDSDLADNQRLTAYYQQHAKLPKAWFTEFGDQTYYLNSQQALKFGLIDEIADKL